MLVAKYMYKRRRNCNNCV